MNLAARQPYPLGCAQVLCTVSRAGQPCPPFGRLSSSLPRRPTGLQGASVCLSDLPSTLSLRTKCGIEDRVVSKTLSRIERSEVEPKGCLASMLTLTLSLSQRERGPDMSLCLTNSLKLTANLTCCRHRHLKFGRGCNPHPILSQAPLSGRPCNPRPIPGKKNQHLT